MIPLSKPYLTDEDAQAVFDTVKSGWILQGPKVEEFEELLRTYINIPYAVAVSNCTTGLHMALKIMEIGPGDEVIVPSYSYIATTNCVVHAGATPVFAEIDDTTFNINPLDVEQKITNKTKAIIVVDQMGLCADWDPFITIAKKHNILLLEDAACGLGSTYKSKNAGTFGDIAAFSFHPRKAITTAEGGLLVTKNKNWYETAKLMRAHGANISVAARNASKKVMLEEFPIIGYNYRMSDIHAALGITQFNKIQEIMNRRQEIAKLYNLAFKNHPIIIPPFVPDGYHHTYQTYQVRLKGFKSKRNLIMQEMLDRDIVIRQGIPSAHLQPPYKKMYPKLSLPITELASQETICLPLFTSMTDTEVQQVISTLLSFVI
jgi:perosamine synthetase